MRRFSPKLSERESLEYTALWQTLKIPQQSQTYFQTLRESSDFSETLSNFSDTFKESHNTGFTDGLLYIRLLLMLSIVIVLLSTTTS